MNDFFKIERKRQKLAEKENLAILRNLYKKDLPELQDNNKPSFWDELNSIHNSATSFSPMEFDKLQKAVDSIKGDHIKVLNIGFGSANLEKIFFSKSRTNVEWKAIDIADKSINSAKKRFPKASFKKGNILELNYKPNTFDYVVSLEVLEHIQPHKIFSVLTSIRQFLKEDGFFILSVPINEGLEDMIKRGENPNAHLRNYTVDLIKAELTLCGFSIVKIKTFYAFNSNYKLKTLIARILPGIKNINGVLLIVKPII